MAESSYPVFPTAVAVPVLALMALIIDIPPLAWHIRNHNLAASSLVCWVMLSNLMNFSNALIWPTDDTEIWWDGSGLCDVEVKLMIAINFGFVGALVCIMRKLAKVLNTKRTVLSPSRAERRRETAVECLLCFGGPIYSIAVHYIVQPSRYYIFAISGCTSSYDNSWPKIALILIWPPLLGVVVVYYSVLVVIRMRRYRRDFSEVLSSSNSNMTKSRFLRLFLLSMTLIAVMFPTQSYVLYQNSVVPLIPYSWDIVHGPGWNQIFFVPAGGVVIFDRWAQIALGFAIFPFFGLGQDAQKLYRQGLLKMGFGRLFPCLHRESSTGVQQGLLTNSHPESISSRGRLFFHRKQSRGSSFSLPSHGNSIPPSIATLSPTETQKAFGRLSTISEADRGGLKSSSSPSNPMLQKPVQSLRSGTQEPWLDQLIHTEMPASQSKLSARPSNLAGPHGLGILEANEQTSFHRLNSSDAEKGLSHELM